jgi:hypothetical protein
MRRRAADGALRPAGRIHQSGQRGSSDASAAELLLRRLDRASSPETITLPTYFVARESAEVAIRV